MTDSCIALPTSPDAPLLLHGDCLDMLARLPDASVHAVVTDPPAGIGFMGKPWDSFAGHEPRSARGREVAERLRGLLPAWAVGFVVFLVDVWVEVDRVLKPGGFVCAWALPKTADLAGLAMRAVGWTIHDSLLHLFGSGFPKSMNVAKAVEALILTGGSSPKNLADAVDQTGQGQSSAGALGMKWDKGDGTRQGVSRHAPGGWEPTIPESMSWSGWGTALAPGHEHWLLARKPTPLTYAANVLAHCTGALHVDACRIPRGEADQAAMQRCNSPGSGRFVATPASEQSFGRPTPSEPYDPSRGSWPRNVLLTCGGEECPAEELDRQGGVLKTGGGDKAGAGMFMSAGAPRLHDGDSGGASRYFTRFDDRVRYQAKASDRGAGLRSDIVNGHPTHKHVGLMRWLVRLLAATAETTGDDAAIVLDPFAGSFTTGVACVAERVRFIGIERDASSFEVGRARVLAAIGSPVAAAEANEAAPAGAQLAML